jgi:hypothetical protein
MSLKILLIPWTQIRFCSRDESATTKVLYVPCPALSRHHHWQWHPLDPTFEVEINIALNLYDCQWMRKWTLKSYLHLPPILELGLVGPLLERYVLSKLGRQRVGPSHYGPVTLYRTENVLVGVLGRARNASREGSKMCQV